MRDIGDQTARFLQAWMRVRQVVQAANFNRFHQAGLSATQFMTLNVIREEGTTLTVLARHLKLSPASLKKTVDSLEERRLVTRKKHPSDARKLMIMATPRGRRLQNEASGDFHHFMGGIFRSMSPGEREGLLLGLERMAERSSPAQAADAATPRDGAALLGKRSSRRSPRP